MKLFEITEPQYCSDPDCDGEITWDETNKKYVCMKCDKPALTEAAYQRQKFEPTDFRIGKNVRSNNIRRGMMLAAPYNNGGNEFTDYIEVLGFTGNDQKYGEGGVKYNSAKEMYKANNVTSLKALEAKDNENEYGYSHYMYLRDLTDDSQGSWFYIFEGRWVRGSGADRLSFYELERIPREQESSNTFPR